jgi:Predicted acyltransferase
MQIHSKAILIYPDDASIAFLQPIADKIAARFPNIDLFRPNHEGFYLTIDDEHEVVFYLGHGNNAFLFSSHLGSEGGKNSLSVNHAGRLFSDTSVVLLSCDSLSFIKNIGILNLKSFFGFGDMPTDMDHVRNLRSGKPDYLDGITDEHLDFYRGTLVDSFLMGLNWLEDPSDLRPMFLGMKYVINKAIGKVLTESLWDNQIRTHMVGLLHELKVEIGYSRVPSQ